MFMCKYYPSLAKYTCALVVSPEEYYDWILLTDDDYLYSAQYNNSGTETDIYVIRMSKHPSL
jgi:hypothetical protein